MVPRVRLGEILMTMGAIDELQLASALAHQRQWGTPLGQTLVEKRFLSKDTLMRALSQQAGLAAIDLDQEYLGTELARLMPRKAAEQLRVVPIHTEGKRNEVLVVAIAAPASLSTIDAVQKASGKLRVRALLAHDVAIERAIARIYDGRFFAGSAGDAAAIPLQETEIDMEPSVARARRPVLIHGWGEKTCQTLALVLAAEGIFAKAAKADDLLDCTAADVVVAPLEALEGLFPVSICPAKIVVVGPDDALALHRAQMVGAKAFLGTPLDTGLFLRAVRRLVPGAEPVTLSA